MSPAEASHDRDCAAVGIDDELLWLAEFRFVHWVPALRAAGLDHHTLYDARHTSITWALSAGVPVAKVALVHGTSIKQLDAT